MKNLKKVLALGLALVMLLGMFTVVSAAETKKTASDLTDWNAVSHKDAVSLMVDLGIIKGMPDGSFAPTGNIDRASWAKMVYFAATGSEDADAYLGTATGLGDIAGNWAESYISFLKANNYISGDNLGNYNPSNNVTVAEACKMMLTVLGFDADDRGYQNDNAWSGKIMNDAKRNGLMNNVDRNMTALVPLTRENAAEIVLNALNANMVEGIPQWDNGNRYITTYSKLHTLGYDVFDMVKVTATVTGFDPNGFAIFANAKITDKVPFSIESALSGKVKADSKMVGEEVNVYVKADGAKWDKDGEQYVTGAFQSVISTTAAQANSTPVKVITSGITRWNDLITRGTNNFVATNWVNDDDTTAAYYLNGKECTDNGTAVKAAAAKRGTVVEFYTDVDGKIATVKAYEYTVDQVENGDASTKTLSDGTVQVRVPGVVNGYVDADKVTGWQGLVDGDVVLYYRTDLGQNTYAYTIEKAEKVTGNVTSFNSSGVLTIGGKAYRGSEQPGSGAIGDVSFTAYDPSGTHSNDAQGIFGAWTSSYNLTDEYDFYLDKNGAIVAAIQVTESMDSSKVCMVLETEVADSGLGVTGNLRANLLFVDGSTEIVAVSKVGVNDGSKVVTKNVVDKVTNADRQISTSDAQKAIAGAKDAAVMTKFFNYRATSAGYELNELNAANYPRNWETPVSKGDGSKKEVTILQEGSFVKPLGTTVAGTKSPSDWTVTANSSTTFVVGKRNANDDTVTYSVYKGFRNVPIMDATMVTAICANTSNVTTDVNTVAKYVYLETGAFKDDVPDGYVFIYSNEVAIDPELAEDEVYLVKIVDVDGQLTTMRVTGALADQIAADPTTLNGTRKYVGNFFAIGEIDEHAVVSSLTDGEEQPHDKPVVLDSLVDIGGDVIVVGTESYDYDGSTVFVYVDMGWTDGTQANNDLNTREPGLDDIDFKDAGNFSPNGFFNENDVNATSNANGETYIYVDAVVVCPANSTTADYVYVLRTLW